MSAPVFIRTEAGDVRQTTNRCLMPGCEHRACIDEPDVYFLGCPSHGEKTVQMARHAEISRWLGFGREAEPSVADAYALVSRPGGLAQDSQGRKEQPIFRGALRYFPDAIAEVSELSRLGNDKHNPGQPMHWNRSKSGDELDCVARHLLECLDADGKSVWIEGEYSKPVRHLTALCWRALAALQKQIEAERGDGKISPGSRAE